MTLFGTRTQVKLLHASCGMWSVLNSACYYGISSVFQYLKCSGRETGFAKKKKKKPEEGV